MDERASINQLTIEVLLEMEELPKTKKEIRRDYIISFLPVVMGILSLLEYYYMPNYSGKKNTHIYGVFMGIMTLGFFIYFLITLKNKRLHKKLRYKAPFYILVLLILTTYDILTLKSNVLIMPYFPWVDHVFNSAISDYAYLWESLVNSLKLLFTGYFIGALLGFITGVFCGYSKTVSYWIKPFMKILGPIPTPTWLPIVMVLAKSLFGGAVFIIALGVWFAVTLSTMTGILNIDREYFQAAQTLGATENELIYRVAIPAATPSIFQGLTQGMSSACTALLLAEMLGVESGLGWYINWQKSWAEFSKMYAAIVLICITFIVVNKILNMISERVLVWQEGKVN